MQVMTLQASIGLEVEPVALLPRSDPYESVSIYQVMAEDAPDTGLLLETKGQTTSPVACLEPHFVEVWWDFCCRQPPMDLRIALLHSGPIASEPDPTRVGFQTEPVLGSIIHRTFMPRAELTDSFRLSTSGPKEGTIVGSAEDSRQVTPLLDKLEVPLLFSGPNLDRIAPYSFKLLYDCSRGQQTVRKDLPNIQADGFFERLIVMPDLAIDLVAFKCLPVPLFSNLPREDKKLSTNVVKAMATGAAMLPIAASDSLYLDWHLSQSTSGCRSARCSNLSSELQLKFDQPSTVFVQQNGEKILSDIELLQLTPEETVIGVAESGVREERRVVPSSIVDSSHQQARQAGPQKEMPDKQQKVQLGMKAPSMSGELSIFMQARKGTLDNETPKICPEASPTVCNEKKSTVGLMDSKREQPEDKTSKTWIKRKRIAPSLEMQQLVVVLEKEYIKAIQAARKEGSNVVVPFGTDEEGCLALQGLIKELAVKQHLQRQGLLRKLLTLYILRQTAYNGYEYGIKVAHLYLEHSLQTMPFIKGDLVDSCRALAAYYSRVEAAALQDHPKLSALFTVLQEAQAEEKLRDTELPFKVLIIADKRVFFTMYRLLISAGLKPYQIDREGTLLSHGHLDTSAIQGFEKALAEALQFSDCILAAPGYYYYSFPATKFSLAIIYSDGITFMPWQEISCKKVLLHMESSSKHQQEEQPVVIGPSQSRSGLHADISQQKDAEDQRPGTSLHATWQTTKPQTLFPQPTRESHQVAHESAECSTLNSTVVINTDTTYGSSVASNRFLYQNILQLERERLQVIEREMAGMVDLLLTPSTCLTVYTLKKLGIESLALQRDPENTISNCIDIVIDSGLKPLSFAYQRCLLVFQGPQYFITWLLEYMDDLHAAAVGLGIQLQCLYSVDTSTTASILLRCIQATRKKAGKQVIGMSETQTVAEAFLTSFPSINPLTAQAILQAGVPLPVFICLSLEQQLATLKDYGVGERSLTLFQAQCQHREHAEGHPQELPQEQTMERAPYEEEFEIQGAGQSSIPYARNPHPGPEATAFIDAQQGHLPVLQRGTLAYEMVAQPQLEQQWQGAPHLPYEERAIYHPNPYALPNRRIPPALPARSPLYQEYNSAPEPYPSYPTYGQWQRKPQTPGHQQAASEQWQGPHSSLYAAGAHQPIAHEQDQYSSYPQPAYTLRETEQYSNYPRNYPSAAGIERENESSGWRLERPIEHPYPSEPCHEDDPGPLSPLEPLQLSLPEPDLDDSLSIKATLDSWMKNRKLQDTTRESKDGLLPPQRVSHARRSKRLRSTHQPTVISGSDSDGEAFLQKYRKDVWQSAGASQLLETKKVLDKNKLDRFRHSAPQEPNLVARKKGSTDTPRARKTSSETSCWTPLDKRANQTLSYAKKTGSRDKQSTLTWMITNPAGGSRKRKSATFTM
eukprot:jgi/Mesen1/3049/ME000018S02359